MHVLVGWKFKASIEIMNIAYQINNWKLVNPLPRCGCKKWKAFYFAPSRLKLLHAVKKAKDENMVRIDVEYFI